MKFVVGAALVAFAGLTVPAMAQTAAPAPAAEKKASGVRIKCNDEAVTGSFTRKLKQCRQAVGSRSQAAKTPAAPAPAAPEPAPEAGGSPAQ